MARGRKPQNEKAEEKVEQTKEEEKVEKNDESKEVKSESETVAETPSKAEEKEVVATAKVELEDTTSTKPAETTSVPESSATNNTTTDGWGEDTAKPSTGGWGEDTTKPSTGGWGEDTAKPSTGGWGEDTTKPSTGGWGEDTTKPSTGGWGEDTTKPSTGGWGEDTTKPSTGGWGEDTTKPSTGGWGAPEFNDKPASTSYRSDSYNSPTPRGQDDSSYRRRNDSYGGGYQSDNRSRGYEDRPPRQYDNDRRYNDRSDRGRPDPYQSHDSRKRYEPSGEYGKRPRYDRPRDDRSRDDRSRDDRPRNDDHYSSRPRDDSYGRGRDDRYANSSRPPYDDYERGRDYSRNSSYESRGETDRPYEPRVSRPKKPFPTDVSPSKAIGIFGLSIHATENDLREFLSEELSDISDYKITVVHDRNTGMSKGYGFVYFQCLEDSIKAKGRLVGKSIKGKEIRVDYSISDALRPSYR